jgi:hypothetical protein
VALPTVPADGLARRLNLPYPGQFDAELDATMDAAELILAGHVDEMLVAAYPTLWGAAVTGLAVKLWDTATRGTVGMDAVGEFEMPSPSATAGLLNSVAALWHPLTLTGGNVVA